jgi:hypothetical protein
MAIAFPSFKLLYLMDIQQIYINYLDGTYLLAAIPVKFLSSKSTALVPYGIAYRGSTIGISYNKTVLLRSRGLIFFPKSVISLLRLVGHMLGDGSLSLSRTSVTPYFIFTQTVKRFDYA